MKHMDPLDALRFIAGHNVERSQGTNVGRYITEDPYRRIPDFCPLPKGTIIVEEDAP